MHDVFEIAEILVSHATAVHEDEIAIIAYYGSYAKGLATPTSDLDIFYIPDDGQAGALSSQFILDDLPYDFWPISWLFAEAIANAQSGRPWAASASLIADARVLFYRSQADLDRFNKLQARIAELTTPQSRPEMVERALDAYKESIFNLGQLRLATEGKKRPEIYSASWNFVNSAVNCLALLNQTYFSRAWGDDFSRLMQMPDKPDDLDRRLKDILTLNDETLVLETAVTLAKDIRQLLLSAQQSVAQPVAAQAEFRDFYYYVFEYRNKVLKACKQGDVIAAGFAAFLLQDLLSRLMNKVEYGIFGADINLLTDYSHGYQKAGFPDLLSAAAAADLETLAIRVVELDEAVKTWFLEHSIDLNILSSKEELRRFLRARDPAS
jgi:hypothetical protein